MASVSFTQYTELIEEASKTSPFESENFLIDMVINHIGEFLGGHVVVSTEIPVGAGIVDVVAGRIHKDTEIQCNFSYQTLTRTEAYVLSNLFYKQRLKLNTIARRTNLSVNLTEHILAKLCTAGYSKMVGQCYLRTKPPIDALVAIEGKIKNWKRALQQAIRNQLFTSQSYVALDARYSKPALKNIAVFKKYQVGLAIIFRSGYVEIVYRPPFSYPVAPIMPIIAEAALLERTKIWEC